MFRNSTEWRKIFAILVLAVGGVASPLFADTVSECYEKVLVMCDGALDEASWWEKPAVGLVCTGMLAGCGFEAL